MYSTAVPTSTYPDAGSPVLGIYRSAPLARFAEVGAVLGFFTDDYRFDYVLRDPTRYGRRFLDAGITDVVAPDFSMYLDDTPEMLDYAREARRVVGLAWEDVGLRVAPCLNWAGPETWPTANSFYAGDIPVAYVECQSGGRTQEERELWFDGLAYCLRYHDIGKLVIYGGATCAWLKDYIPRNAVLLPGHTHLRRAV